MTTYVVSMYSYRDASSDKLWGIKEDGSRLIVFFGPRGGRVQKRSVKISAGRTIAAEREHRIDEQRHSGYTLEGTAYITDGQLSWEAKPATPLEAIVRDLAIIADCNTPPDVANTIYEILEAQSKYGFEVNRTENTVRHGQWVAQINEGSMTEISAGFSDGPMAIAAVLAIARHCKCTAYDAQQREVTARWIEADSKTFGSAEWPHATVVEFGRDTKLLAPALKLKAGAVRPSLFT